MAEHATSLPRDSQSMVCSRSLSPWCNDYSLCRGWLEDLQLIPVQPECVRDIATTSAAGL